MKKQLNKQQIEIPSDLKRVNYYFGQLLSQAEFQTEQSYFRKRIRLHNLYQHGYGVVSGLSVSASKDSPGKVTVTPGVAIDSFGNEIILTEDAKVPFPKKGDVAHLVLFWAERETDFVPAPTGYGEGDEKMASRVQEYAILKYEIDDSSVKPGGIVLARLKRIRSVWKVDKRFHACRVKP